MKRQLFIILLLGASVCLSWGQNGPKKYYEYINKAELAYIQMSDDNGLGQKAAQYYEKAFAANRPFSKARTFGCRPGMRPHFGPKRNVMAEMV